MGHVWGRKEIHTLLVFNHEGNRPLERPERRWEDNIKVDPKEIE